MTGTNGAHVEVTVRMGDPLTVTNEPCHDHGRVFPQPIVRELLRSFGVKTCPHCHRFTGMAPRTERPMRRKGTGWREIETTEREFWARMDRKRP